VLPGVGSGRTNYCFGDIAIARFDWSSAGARLRNRPEGGAVHSSKRLPRAQTPSASSAISGKVLRSILQSILQSRAIGPDPVPCPPPKGFGASPETDYPPSRCFVRVVGLRGWCGMERRARDAADRQTTGTNGREVPGIRLESQSQGRSQRQRQRQRTTRQGCRAGRAASMAKTKRISRPGQKSRGEGW